MHWKHRKPTHSMAALQDDELDMQLQVPGIPDKHLHGSSNQFGRVLTETLGSPIVYSPHFDR
jgi:hypothetical protein